MTVIQYRKEMSGTRNMKMAHNSTTLYISGGVDVNSAIQQFIDYVNVTFLRCQVNSTKSVLQTINRST